MEKVNRKSHHNHSFLVLFPVLNNQLFMIDYLGLPFFNALSAIFTAFFSLQFAYFSLKVILIKLSIAPCVNKLHTLATFLLMDWSQALKLN